METRIQEYQEVIAQHGKGMDWKYVVQALRISEDGAFTERVLKVHPVDRSTAAQLLKDP